MSKPEDRSESEPTTGDAEGVAPSLVTATFLDRPARTDLEPWQTRAGRQMGSQRPGEWSFTLSPEAGEGGGSFRSARPARRGLWVPPGEAADPDRAASEAARRARAKVRRFCAAHRLNRLGTLTYAGQGCYDIDEHLANTARFWRQLRRDLDVDALPYVRVWEWHPKGHGLHEHFAVARFIKWSLVESAWGLGRVDMRLIRDLGIGSSARQEARAAARYLAPYLSKTGEDDRPSGRHRYEIAQGFPIATERFTGRSAAEVVAVASERMGASPDYVWHSDEASDWQAPPATWAEWR